MQAKKFTKLNNKDPYYSDGATWEHEIVANALQSKSRAWVISFFCMGVSILCLITLILLLPLKTFEPYVVTVERSSGYVEVTKGLHDSKLTEEEAITQSSIVRYISAREQYNPAILEQNYEFVSLMSTDKALKEFKNLWSASNPNNPSIKLGHKATVDVKIKSVSFLNEKTASVRFLREQHSNEKTKVSHWNAIIEFQYSGQPMTMADRFSNPLGFQILTYRVNPEVLESIK